MHYRRMGKVRIAVFISLACNLLLATAYWAQISRRRPPPEAGVETKSSPLITTQSLEKKVTNTITVAVAAKSLGWRTVESEDYPKYIANLRSVGCPEKTIRDVIIADINELYRQRYRELFSPTNRIEYWKPGNPMANLFDETKLTKENALRQEKRELVRTLLGSACPDEEDLSAIQMDSFNERLFNFLTPEKRTAMKELEDKFAIKLMKTYKDTWRGNDAPAQSIIAEKDEAMLGVLTPEEKFDYDLRRSDTAMILRVGLGGFQVSEEEFRTMFPQLKQFIEAAGKEGFGAVMRGEPDPRPEGRTARTVLQTKLKNTLGEERFRRLVEQTGWDFKAEEQQ